LPRRFGPYLLLDRLGEGGIGTVHLARPLDVRRGVPTPVVIKRLNDEVGKDSQLLRRFEHEATIAVRVDSPHVVKVYDVGAVDRQPYLAMEYIQGWMLARVFQALLDARRYAPIPATVEMILGGLRGLEALHDAADPRTGEPLGVVHRDVSPRNLMLDEHGCLRLIDLGLGKSNLQDWKTRTGMVMGSPGYMAPEQTRGGPVDHRTDLYAIATVLYEILVLRPYIPRGERMQMLLAMENPTYVPMTEHRSNVPRELEEVVRRALAPDPEDRFPTARAFIDALESAVPVRDSQTFGRMVRELLGGELEEMKRRVVGLLEDETAPDEEGEETERSQTVIYAVRSGVATLDDREPKTVLDEPPPDPTPLLTAPILERPPAQRPRGIPVAVVVLLVAVTAGVTIAVERISSRPPPAEIRTTPLAEEPPPVRVEAQPRASSVEAPPPPQPPPTRVAVKRKTKVEKIERVEKVEKVEPQTIASSFARVTALARDKRAQHPARAQEIDAILTDASIWARSRDTDKALPKLAELEARLTAMQ
jgi:serine/threonine-protein kinase